MESIWLSIRVQTVALGEFREAKGAALAERSKERMISRAMDTPGP